VKIEAVKTHDRFALVKAALFTSVPGPNFVIRGTTKMLHE
jgi:hypothetical protein